MVALVIEPKDRGPAAERAPIVSDTMRVDDHVDGSREWPPESTIQRSFGSWVSPSCLLLEQRRAVWVSYISNGRVPEPRERFGHPLMSLFPALESLQEPWAIAVFLVPHRPALVLSDDRVLFRW